ncbi:hypothetical protein CKO50_17300 [Pseudoalteromonas sp. HM-SA03]|nr:hypothetical protein CKO50_17300 [Pseudoalteromonas sp. HM-SA03]
MLHLSGVAWASSVSIYNNELKEQIVTASVPLSLVGILFMLSNSVAVILLTLRHRGNHITLESERALPPASVISFSADIHKANLARVMKATSASKEMSIESDKDVKSKNHKKQVANSVISEMIKETISSMVELANNWNQSRLGELKYSANLFSVIKKDDLDFTKEEELREAVESSPFFLYVDSFESRTAHCDYLIISQQEYSTCNKKKLLKNGQMMVLPFSDSSTNLPKFHPNFEGAPQSLLTGQARYISDTKVLSEAFFKGTESTGHAEFLTKNYKAKIEQYYLKDDTLSLLSIPLFDSNNNYLAVLNIYSEQKNMLYSEDRAKAFYDFIRPHTQFVATLIEEQIKVASL